MMNYAAIPQEMRSYKQWIVWRKEEGTKVPYQINGKLASTTKPGTWSTFAEACEASPNYDGIGFVFSENDPYTGIDLDATTDADGVARQKLIFEKMESYSEVSPSGQGLHIIIKAKVPSGRRRDKVEIYSTTRFFTMTGNAYLAVPIEGRQELADVLWSEMGVDSVKAYHGDLDEKCSDDEILHQALTASNGDKFQLLLDGNWQDNYQSQSEADFAFVDIIAFYTQNRNQIVRIFRASKLGKRKKAQRSDYMEYMLNRAFDRMLPPIDIDGLHNRFQDVMAQSKALAVIEDVPTNTEVAAEDTDSSFAFPPGLVGDIADYIYKSAPRPVRSIALTAAIGLMAGIVGRAYNVRGTGLNQYLLLLAQTGTGKEAMASGISRLMTAIRDDIPAAMDFIGPSEIASGQALVKLLSNATPSFVSILGEFGYRLQQLSNSHMNNSELMLKRVLLDLFGKSGNGNILYGSSYSQKENNVHNIDSPALSILAESTPHNVYGQLGIDAIEAGLLPRFTIFEYTGPRVPLNPYHSITPPAQLVQHLSMLIGHALKLNHGNAGSRLVVNVDIDPSAEQLLHRIDVFADSKINDASEEVLKHIWNRFHLKVMRLAAIVAVGINPYNPVITADAVKWAAALIHNGTETLLQKFKSGEMGADVEEVDQHSNVITKISEYLTAEESYNHKYMSQRTWPMWNDKIVTHEYLSRRCLGVACFRKDRRGATMALQSALKELMQRGFIEQVGKNQLKEKFGMSIVAYAVTNPEAVIQIGQK